MSACPGWERLAKESDWTAEERRHVDGCARCASFVAEYRAFLAGDESLPQSERLDADRRLADFIGAQVGPALPVAVPRRAVAEPGLFERLSAWFAAPPVRWATSFVMLALVAGVVFVNRAPDSRVGDAQRGVTAAEFVVSVSAAEGGAVHVTWPIAPTADGYRVEVLATDLAVVRSFDATAAQEWQFDSASVPTGAFVRVVAMRMGDRLRETAPAAIPGR